MAIDEKMIADLTKANEGTALALGAVSEVLQKTESTVSQLGSVVQRLLAKAEKEDEDEKAKKEQEEEEESFAKLVKALQYAGFVTKDQTALENSGADSDEKKKPIKSDPGKQQDVIQGSITEPENLPKKAGALKKGDEAEDEEEGKDEKKDEKKDEYPEVEKLKKDLADAQARIVELQKSQDSKIQTAIEDVLGKMGFHREKKAFQPTPVQIGADQDKLQKSADQPTDRIGELAKLSYAELRKLQMAEEAGQLPEDVRKLIS